MASNESDVLINECEKFLKNIIFNLDKSKNMSTELKNDITKNVKDIKSVLKKLNNVIKIQQNVNIDQHRDNEQRLIALKRKYSPN
jgi:hypothetical protein